VYNRPGVHNPCLIDARRTPVLRPQEAGQGLRVRRPGLWEGDFLN
jgi:hypothetical protein